MVESRLGKSVKSLCLLSMTKFIFLDNRIDGLALGVVLKNIYIKIYFDIWSNQAIKLIIVGLIITAPFNFLVYIKVKKIKN